MMLEEDEPKLLNWIVVQLNNMNQSNSSFIAKYIITLLRQNKNNTEDYKAYFIDELKSFLKARTANFVNNLFDVIADGKYKDSANDDDEVDYNEDVDDDYDNRARGRNSNSPHGYADDDDYADTTGLGQSRSRGRHREASFDHNSRPPHDSNYNNNIHNNNNDRQGANRRDTYTGSDRGSDRNKIDYRNTKNVPYHSHNQLQRGDVYAHHPIGGGMAFPQTNTDYMEVEHNHMMGMMNSNNNMIINSTTTMAPTMHPSYMSMNSNNGDFNNTMNMSNQMNMYSGYGQAPMGTPSYANAYQQAFSAALNNPYSNGGLSSYYGSAMNMAGSSIEDPVASKSMGLLGATSSGDQTNLSSVGRVSYEDELMAQHSSSTTVASKPPPPTGPAPSVAINSMQQPSSDTSGGFVYGSSINYSQYASIANAVSPVSSQLGTSTTFENSHPYKEKRGSKQYQQQLLPEHERCTLRCSGIPHYVTEQDIRTHFEAFGSVVELQIVTPTTTTTSSFSSHEEGGGADGKKKVYNECLVQFYSAANAKKCFTSPLPVLNNRFIHLHVSTFNITPVTDVPPPAPEVIERDAQLLTESVIIPSAGSNSVNPTDRGKKTKAYNVHTQGVSNKYRRLSDEHVVVTTPAVVRSDDTTVESNDMSSGAFKDIPIHHEESPVVVVVDPSIEGDPTAMKGAVTSPAGVALAKEKLELKEKHEQLKALRQQAEDILKKKESVLQQQLDKCRDMIDKLESSGDSESKQVLLQSLESKVLTFQTQLRTVREQIDKGADSLELSPSGHTVTTHSYSTAGIPYHAMGFGRISSIGLGGRRGRGAGMGRGSYVGGRRGGGRLSHTVYVRSDADIPTTTTTTIATSALKTDAVAIANGSAVNDPEPHLEGS